MLIPFLFPILPTAVNAQTPPVSFRNIGINEGLSQSSVVSIALDKAGFVWMATQDGLNRYDGKEFGITRRNFDDITTPFGSRLGMIGCNDANELLLLTVGGNLERMNLFTGAMETVNKLGPDSIVLPPLTCFYQDSQSGLWAGTEKDGAYRYQPATGRVTRYPAASAPGGVRPGSVIQSFFEDDQHRCWILTGNGLSFYVPGSAKPYPFLTHSIKDSAINIPCSVMDEDGQGNYWLGTFGKGLYLKRKRDSGFSVFRGFGDSARLPKGLVIEAVLADRRGDIWIGTYGKGLYVLHTVEGRISHYTADNKDPYSIAYNDILCIKEDRAGGIWIGTDGGGVSHYDQRLNNFALISKNNVPDRIAIEQVRSITTDADGGIWIGTSNSGLTKTNKSKDIFHTEHFPPYNKKISNYDRIVSLMTDWQGDIWVGTQGNGLLILDHRNRSIKKRFHPDAPPSLYLPDQTIWCMLPDTGTRVWIGTRNAGLCLLDKNTGLLKRFTLSENGENNIPENNVRTLTRINDSIICLGFEKKGIRLLNTRTFRIMIPPPVRNSSGQELPEGRGEITLKCTLFRNPLLWIGTQGRGLIAWNIFSGAGYLITDKEGLPNNTIYGIIPDQQGAFWMSTNKGICRFLPPADLSATNRSSFSQYTVEDGLQSNEFNTGASFLSPDGKILFGGIKGLTIFDPLSLSAPGPPARVAITFISVNNIPLQNDTVYAWLKKLELPYNRHSIAFNFSALDFTAPGRFNYYYQLTGYDKTWIDAGNRNYAAYTNLPPGSYTFRVKASRNFSGNEDPVSSLSILIHPPFWKRGWFIGLFVLCAVGLVWTLYQYRISQLMRVQKIRSRIAADLHDDIGSTLTNISMLSELSRKSLPYREEAEIFLGRIGQEVEHSSHALDDIVWSINTHNDTIEQTVARMRRYVAEIFDASNIHYTIRLDETFAHRKINMEQRRDFLLIFKEIINNISKHAEAGEVAITIWMDRRRLHLEVKDDGKGFDPLSITHRNGIKNMNNRVKKWNGTITIESGYGKGSSVRIQLPLTR